MHIKNIIEGNREKEHGYYSLLNLSGSCKFPKYFAIILIWEKNVLKSLGLEFTKLYMCPYIYMCVCVYICI